MASDYSNLVNAMLAFVENARNQGPSAMQAVQQMKTLLSKHLNTNNYNYLRTVFFPEKSKGARYPNRFPVTSNTYSTKTSLTLQSSPTGEVGILIRPNVTLPFNSFVYWFKDAQFMQWGQGYPFSLASTYVGPTIEGPGNEFTLPQNRGTTTQYSPKIYFDRSRLIGCSATLSGVTPANALYIGGVSYDTPINELVPGLNTDDVSKFINTSSFYIDESYVLAKDMAVLRHLTLPNDWYNVAGRGAATHPEEFAARTVRELLTNAEASGGGGVRSFRQMIQNIVIAQANLNAEPFSILESFSFGLWRVNKTTESVIRDIERSAKTRNPTTYELMQRLLKIVVFTKFGYFTLGTELDTPDNYARTYNSIFVDDTADAAKAAEFERVKQIFLRRVADLAAKWSYAHSEMLAKLLKDTLGTTQGFISGEAFPNGGLNYLRVKEFCQYYHETKGPEGIRVVYIPDKEPTWNNDSDENLMFIGATGFPPNAKVTLQINRHFEGVPNTSIKELFPGRKELPDLKSIDMVSNIFTLFPQLIQIPANKVDEYYNTMKAEFKWFDMVIYERGGVMEIERPLPTNRRTTGNLGDQPLAL